jgi:bifunctional UDP-N-acetylglucosamine pyrophosphorylase/glucosamine-1-phosphate N-acetyltransferase
MSINGSVLSELIQAVPPQSGTGEYYLTEIVNIASQKGIRCAFTIQEEATAMGVNSRQQLAEAERIFQQKKRQEILDIGVTLEDPSSVYFSYDTLIESDVVVEPHVYFGRGVHVKSGSRIRAFSHIENAQIGKQAVIGPFARIRDSALIGQEACIGNFVEVKNSVIGQGVKARHHTYLGDSDVGAGANIGAGTITCNYDGHTKHRTHIGRGAFVGSLTALVAPVSLGDNAYIGCGSVITENVPDNALAIRRVHHQSVKLNYVQKER